jgi:hypothetical protein
MKRLALNGGILAFRRLEEWIIRNNLNRFGN